MSNGPEHGAQRECIALIPASWSRSFIHQSFRNVDSWSLFTPFNFRERKTERQQDGQTPPPSAREPRPSRSLPWGSETLPLCVTSSHSPEWGVWPESWRRLQVLSAVNPVWGTCLWISNIQYLPNRVKGIAGAALDTEVVTHLSYYKEGGICCKDIRRRLKSEEGWSWALCFPYGPRADSTLCPVWTTVFPTGADSIICLFCPCGRCQMPQLQVSSSALILSFRNLQPDGPTWVRGPELVQPA